MVNITYDASLGMVVTDADGVKIVYNLGDMAWIIGAMALVFLMIPGVGYFYSGLLRKKNALSMIWVSMLSVAVVSFQWFLWGYSLTFADDGGPFIGTFKFFGLKNVLGQQLGTRHVPNLLFCIYQLMFAAFTVAITVGAIAERGRLGPTLVFMFIWTTIVYDPIAYWTWNTNGWSAQLGILDFAGGTPVHITSGTAALVISIYLGERTGYGTVTFKYHNTSYIGLGTVLLWFGWFGFNGGSAVSANLRAVQACIVTNLAASVGGITWMLWDYRSKRRWTVMGFCSGAISGLVAITPGSGFVGAPAAVLFGFMAATSCRLATNLKFIFGYDDTLDIFASHAIGGFVGNVLTGFFAQASIARFDGFTDIKGGCLDHNCKQLGIQLADSAAGFIWSLVVTTIILCTMDVIPFLRLRASEDAETLGIDEAEMGEVAYDFECLEEEITPTVDPGLPPVEAIPLGHLGNNQQ